MVTIVRYFGNVAASLFVLEIYASMIQNKKNVNGARVTQRRLIIDKTMLTIVIYVTTSLTLTIVKKFMPGWSKTTDFN